LASTTSEVAVCHRSNGNAKLLQGIVLGIEIKGVTMVYVRDPAAHKKPVNRRFFCPIAMK
jgi:hypothetical protein